MSAVGIFVVLYGLLMALAAQFEFFAYASLENDLCCTFLSIDNLLPEMEQEQAR